MSIVTKVATTAAATLAVSTVLIAAPMRASAAACNVKMNGTTNTANQAGSRWTVANGLATGTFTVTGDSDCQQTVTLSAWQAPNADKGQPYDQQKLVSHVTDSFGPGVHSLSIQVPNCFYQLDMLPGDNPAGVNGTAQYTQGTLIGSLHGGTQSCAVTPPVTPPQTPPTLPNTGVGSNVIVAGLVAMVLGTAVSYARRLRTA